MRLPIEALITDPVRIGYAFEISCVYDNDANGGR